MIDSDSPAHQLNHWREQPSARWQEWRGLVLFMALLVFLRTTIVDWNHVPTRSMVPTIIPGDRIFVDKTAFGLRLPFSEAPLLSWRTPTRSEVVVFRAPQTGILTVKRVIGLPGDRVSCVICECGRSSESRRLAKSSMRLLSARIPLMESARRHFSGSRSSPLILS